MYMANNLGDLGKTSAAKAQAKLIKLSTKEAAHDTKIAAKVAKYGAGSAKANKVLAKEAKHDAKIGAKVAKYQGIISAENATVPAIVTPPEPVSAPSVTVSPVPQVAPPAPSYAPPPASESFAQPLATPPSLFTPAPSATPDTAPAAPPAESDSKMPLILGAVALGAAFLFFGKKKRG